MKSAALASVAVTALVVLSAVGVGIVAVDADTDGAPDADGASDEDADGAADDDGD